MFQLAYIVFELFQALFGSAHRPGGPGEFRGQFGVAFTPLGDAFAHLFDLGAQRLQPGARLLGLLAGVLSVGNTCAQQNQHECAYKGSTAKHGRDYICNNFARIRATGPCKSCASTTFFASPDYIMEQFQEFVANNPFLWAAVIIVLIALAVTETLRHFKGQRPITTAEAVRLMNTRDAVVVDTRSSSDYDKGHLLNARHVPLAGIEGRAKEISKATDQTIICYCGTGTTAPQAADKLRKLGYTEVHALKGGINAWKADGLPVTSK